MLAYFCKYVPEELFQAFGTTSPAWNLMSQLSPRQMP